MRTAVFNTRRYDREYLERANSAVNHELVFFESRLSLETVSLAQGFQSICVFVQDTLDKPVLKQLAEGGTKFIALRCAGFNNVDVVEANRLDLSVVRVPAYSPAAIAEHTLALILALNRKIHKAYNRIHEGNFSLDGLLGFDIASRTAGVVGTGKIGSLVCKILTGFGCKILASDPEKNPDCIKLGVSYVPIEELYRKADIITLHCPLTSETHHLIDDNSLRIMKDGVMLINTGRGALIDSKAAISALKQGKIGYLGLDVYEEEEGLFFDDHSNSIIQDDVFARLTTFPNVLITSHQGFFTHEALLNIAKTTLSNLEDLEHKRSCANEIIIAK